MFVHDIRIPLNYNDSHNLFCSTSVNMYDICNIIECYICITDVYHLYLYLHFQNIAFLNKGFTCNIQNKLIFLNQNCSFFTFQWDRGGILYTAILISYWDITYITLDSYFCTWPIFIQSNPVSSRRIRLHSCIVDFCRGESEHHRYVNLCAQKPAKITEQIFWEILENNTQVS